MKTRFALPLIVLALAGLTGPSFGQTVRQSRQTDKNQMRSLGTGLGALALDAARRGRGTEALLLGASAAYAGKKYEDARKAQTKENRRECELRDEDRRRYEEDRRRYDEERRRFEENRRREEDRRRLEEDRRRNDREFDRYERDSRDRRSGTYWGREQVRSSHDRCQAHHEHRDSCRR